MRTIDCYKHLNDSDSVSFSIPEVAKIVASLNYGQQRFLCELVKLREASGNMKFEDYAKRTQQLRELLENGWY